MGTCGFHWIMRPLPFLFFLFFLSFSSCFRVDSFLSSRYVERPHMTFGELGVVEQLTSRDVLSFLFRDEVGGCFIHFVILFDLKEEEEGEG